MKRIVKTWLMVGAVVLCQPNGSPVFGGTDGEGTLSPYFLLEGAEPSRSSFPLKDTNVVVTISGVIADVHVIQKYANEGTQPIHAHYVFPASTRASVHGLEMTIGERVVRAKIKERSAARQEFEQAKSEGKSASLLEQQRPNVFTMSVSNILPGDEVQVDLHYSELLVPADGTYEFVYPTVVGPRYSRQLEAGAAESDRWVKSPYLREGSVPPTGFHMAVTLAGAIPLQEVACPSHQVDVQWKTESTASVSLAPSGELSGNRDFILRYRLTGQEIQSGLLLSQGEKENFFLLMVQPPERVNPVDIPPREYIFVLDVSGSMHGFPLNTAKVLMKDLLTHLRETDRFNVVLFSGASRLMAPASVPATEESLALAVQLIDSQQGGGGTELSAALSRAFALPKSDGVSRSVVVVTDGYIAAEREAFQLIQEHLGRSNVFAFGIGTSVNRFLIEGIAKAGQGEPFVVTKPEEAAGAAGRFRDYVQSPLLADVQVRFEDFDVYDVEPPQVPDLFAQRPVVVFGKWRGAAKGRVELVGRGGGKDIRRVIPVSEVEPSAVHNALQYLWARAKVARLSDYAAGSARGQHQEEITALGLAYGLLTDYTSFVAVLDVVRNRGGEGHDVTQPLPLPQGVSNLAVGGGCANAPEPELALLLSMLLPVLAIGVFRRRSS